MIKNNHSNNLCEAWDLTEAEFTHYHGAGRATVVLDEANSIRAVYYHELHQPDDDEAQPTYTKRFFPSAVRQHDGMMSGYQFCPDEPIT